MQRLLNGKRWKTSRKRAEACGGGDKENPVRDQDRSDVAGVSATTGQRNGNDRGCVVSFEIFSRLEINKGLGCQGKRKRNGSRTNQRSRRRVEGIRSITRWPTGSRFNAQNVEVTNVRTFKATCVTFGTSELEFIRTTGLNITPSCCVLRSVSTVGNV